MKLGQALIALSTIGVTSLLVSSSEPVHAAGLRFEPPGEMLDNDPILDIVSGVGERISFEVRLDTTGLTDSGNPFPAGSTLDLSYIFDWDSGDGSVLDAELVFYRNGFDPEPGPFGLPVVIDSLAPSPNKYFLQTDQGLQLTYEGLQIGVQDAPLTQFAFNIPGGTKLNNDGNADFSISLVDAKVHDAQGNILGFVGNQLGGNQSVEVQAPEPLTILGSATALGFGALLKREHSKKQKKSKQKG